MHTIITIILTDILLHLFKQVAEENLKFEALHVRCCSDLVKECIPYTMFHTYTSGGGGLFADSPGFSQGSLAKVMRATLRELFPEVQHRFLCALTISYFKIGEPEAANLVTLCFPTF
jgi:hypothetical protein